MVGGAYHLGHRDRPCSHRVCCVAPIAKKQANHRVTLIRDAVRALNRLRLDGLRVRLGDDGRIWVGPERRITDTHRDLIDAHYDTLRLLLAAEHDEGLG